ncbi:hypothetical protein GCM10023183_23870 [Nibribacter koreensis]|uniref:Uncharacterized protein n=1 Tax=Nibribacter koreensis TaxID=1084519 RepID=A0ABP8FNE2_9BACT
MGSPQWNPHLVTASTTSTSSSLSVESPKQVAASGRRAVATEQDGLVRPKRPYAEEASWYSARREDGAPRPRALGGNNETKGIRAPEEAALLRNSQRKRTAKSHGGNLRAIEGA